MLRLPINHEKLFTSSYLPFGIRHWNLTENSNIRFLLIIRTLSLQFLDSFITFHISFLWFSERQACHWAVKILRSLFESLCHVWNLAHAFKYMSLPILCQFVYRWFITSFDIKSWCYIFGTILTYEANQYILQFNMDRWFVTSSWFLKLCLKSLTKKMQYRLNR